MTIVGPIIYLFLNASLNLPQDSTIDFEKRRNVPVRYDRELVQTTIKAMKRIQEIRTKRERAFFKNRCVCPPCTLAMVRSSIVMQYGRCPRQAEGSSQEDARCRKDVRQAPRACLNNGGSDTGKNQGLCKVKVGAGTRGGTVHGNGSRLVDSHRPRLLDLISFIALTVVSYHIPRTHTIMG